MSEIVLGLLQADKSEKNIDYLTGLINRRGLYEIWEMIPADMKVHCIYLDVDNFKLVNDIYGHSRGDELLEFVSRILSNEFSNQIVVRMGGDEFVVVCSGTMDVEELEWQLQELQGILKEEFDESLSALLSFSIGLITNQSVSIGISVILDQCDEAMYYVKKNGKSSYVNYDDIKEQLIEQKAMKDRALTALYEKEIEMFLRPIVYMQNSDVYAADVVMRWNFPGLGILPEEKFLPVFEQYGVITKLDEIAFEQVCKWKNQWKGTVLEHIEIYVRISGLYILQVNGVNYLRNCLETYQVSPKEIKICIEENAFLGRNEKMGYAIDLLTEIGFDIAIQNFGSASSFMVLQNIPANILKLDQTLLPHEIESEWKKVNILRNVISMGRDLRFMIVAQGIENSSQAEMLANYGTQLGLGDFYGKPQSAEAFYHNYKNRYFFAKNVKPTIYAFRENLLDEEGKNRGSYSGEGLYYDGGVTESQSALHMPGGRVKENLVRLPKEVMYSESYTICLWVNTDAVQPWTSIIYVTYMDGFMSLVPTDGRGSCVFRMKDDREPNAWFDVWCRGAVPGQWAYICISYDVITGVARLYFNGLLNSSRDYAPNLKVANQIFLGGDEYQESYQGRIAGLEIYHCVLSGEEIERKFKEYQSDPTFLGTEGRK
ncbi:MAG: EAL domain-containing protein [Lachnospiraceae bacterium]|nr:EAL domain-containing protein [Lachnospiraceae bacterium]